MGLRSPHAATAWAVRMLHTTYTSHAVQRCTMQRAQRPMAIARLRTRCMSHSQVCRRRAETRSATSFSQLAMATPVRWVLASIRSDVPNFHDADFDAEGLTAQRCEIGIVKVLPATATRCSVRHHAATCNMLQRGAPCCDMLRHSATCCNAVQHTAPCCGTARSGAARGDRDRKCACL